MEHLPEPQDPEIVDLYKVKKAFADILHDEKLIEKYITGPIPTEYLDKIDNKSRVPYLLGKLYSFLTVRKDFYSYRNKILDQIEKYGWTISTFDYSESFFGPDVLRTPTVLYIEAEKQMGFDGHENYVVDYKYENSFHLQKYNPLLLNKFDLNDQIRLYFEAINLINEGAFLDKNDVSETELIQLLDEGYYNFIVDSNIENNTYLIMVPAFLYFTPVEFEEDQMYIDFDYRIVFTYRNGKFYDLENHQLKDEIVRTLGETIIKYTTEMNPKDFEKLLRADPKLKIRK